MKQADELVDKGDYNKAESIYKSLIPYHSEAVTHLAEMLFYYPEAKDIEHYKKILACKSFLIDKISNIDSFGQIEQKVFDEMDSKIVSLVNAKKYKELLEWVELALSRNQNLSTKERNELILLDSKCRFNYALGLFNSDRQKAEELFEDLYSKSEQYSFPSDYSIKIRNRILSIANNYVAESDIINANHFFRLILSKEPSVKEIFIDSNMLYINQIISDQSAISFLFDTINSIEDKKIVASYFERLVGKVPAAGEQYVLSIISISSNYIKNEEYSDALELLASALSKKVDYRFYDMQRNIAQKYISISDYYTAINILSLLVGKHGDAEPLLASCYLRKAENEKSLDVKQEELIKAFQFKENHLPLFNSSLYNGIFPRVVDNMLALAKKYVSYEYFEDAYALLSMIFPYSKDACEEYLNTKLLESYKISDVNGQITLLEELIQFGKQKIENQQYNKSINTVFTNLIDKTISKISQNQDFETRINELTNLYQRISKENFLSKESSLQMIQPLLAQVYFEKGMELEKNLKIESAINFYTKIIHELKSNWIKEVVNRNDVLGRIYICQFKKGDIRPEKIETFLLQELSMPIKRDLAFRFSVFLLKQQNYEKAWMIAKKYLPTTNETEIIKKKYESAYKSKAQFLLDTYNAKIQKINDGTLTLMEALDLYENLSETETAIVLVFTDIKGQIVANKNIIFAYILRKYFENEQYIEYLNNVQKLNRQFYEDDDLFRNVAIASLGVVKTNQLNANNYKIVIANWLTAVFHDKLFIKSLDCTSWYDNYTFTLYDSLGKTDKYEILPENINFDEPSSSNISIGSVQRSLLYEFEQSLSENCNSAILPQIQKFYNEEKNAISQLYQILGFKKEFFVCTPHFAENHPEIHVALSSQYFNNNLDEGNLENEESILQTGILYKIQGEKYSNYFEAQILSTKCIEAAKEQNAAQIRLLYSETNIEKISPYKELYEKFISDIQNCLNEQIKSITLSYKSIISNYLNICQVVPDVNIKFILSNFAYNECLKKLNNNIISTPEALQILTDVQNVILDNIKINNLIPNIQLSDLVEKMNTGKITLVEGLTKMYDLYISYPNHQRICENLVIVCSNAIFNVIIENRTSSYKVQNILDNICNNRSSEFRAAAKDLAFLRQKTILNLPYHIQMLVQKPANSVILGKSLNAQGISLKIGLDYLQRLSQ